MAILMLDASIVAGHLAFHGENENIRYTDLMWRERVDHVDVYGDKITFVAGRKASTFQIPERFAKKNGTQIIEILWLEAHDKLQKSIAEMDETTRALYEQAMAHTSD